MRRSPLSYLLVFLFSFATYSLNSEQSEGPSGAEIGDHECVFTDERCCRCSRRRGPTGPTGPMGVAGLRGPTGPEAPASWVRVYDPATSNIFTSNGSAITLSAAPIDPAFSTGGYSLTSTGGRPNDTLLFPEPGCYLVQISLRIYFPFPNDIPISTIYNFSFSFYDGSSSNYPSMFHQNYVLNQVASNDTSTLTSNLVICNPNSAPSLQVNVRALQFDYQGSVEITIDRIYIVVQKLS